MAKGNFVFKTGLGMKTSSYLLLGQDFYWQHNVENAFSEILRFVKLSLCWYFEMHRGVKGTHFNSET